MPEVTTQHYDEPARIGPFGDTGDAWARVQREIDQVARQGTEQIQHRWLSRASALLRYHARASLNPVYAGLLDGAGEAGALGAAPAGDGVYRTFSETHLIEVVDQGGRPAAVGSRGDVVVTQFDAWAAPIIRYRVGDRATYRGWEQGRLLLSDIERSAEAAIGSTLIPYSDLQTWAPRLAALDRSVVAVQLVRAYSASDQRERPVVRIIGGTGAGPGLAAAALALLDDFPQVAGEVASGELAPALVECRDPPTTLAGHWKIPLYTDERTRPEGPCPSD